MYDSSPPVPDQDDILQDISINKIPPDIRNFNPNDPIHSVASTDNVHQDTSQLTIVSEHQLDPTSPAQFNIDFSLPPATSSIVCSTTTSSQQAIPPISRPVHQQQHGTYQSVLQQHHGDHHSERPVHTGAHQVITTQNQDSIVSAPPGDVNTQTDTSGASISILSTDTSVNNNSSDDITQVEVHHEQHDTHDVVDSDASKQQRNVVITETIMQQFLDKIGNDHFPDFDQYHPGLTWTDKGYVYNPQLMNASQSRSLNRFIMQLQNEPTYFKKLLNKMRKAVTSSSS